MAEIKNNENLTASLSSVENLNAEVQSKEEVLKGKIAQSILYFKGENGKSPYIGTNGSWFIYDDENKEWIDTGVNAVVDLSKYYTKTETDNKIKEITDWINEQINNFYTKEEIDKKFEDLDIGTGGEIDISGKEDKSNKVRQVDENDLDSLTEEQYLSAKASATLIRGLRNAIDEKSDLSKEDIEEMLSDTFENIEVEINKKANSADSLAGYGIKDAYTKDEINFKENALKVNIKSLKDEDVALAENIKKVEDKSGNLEKELITTNSSIASLTNDLNKINSNVEDLSSELEKSNIAIKENKENIETALSIAKGRATGYVFDTVADLDIWLSKKENTDNLVAGDNFYIKAIDVPDYWWDGVSKQQLETQKVNLTEYYNKQEIDNQIEPLQSDVGILINFTEDLTKNISNIEKEFENYDTSIEVDRKISNLNDSVQTTFSAMQSEIIKKADKSKSLSGYGIEDAYTKEEIDDLIPEQIEVVNNLTSTDTDKALSANQGKILNDKITDLDEAFTDYYNKEEVDNLIPEQVEIVDNLTSTNTDKALSANQGKILNEKSKALQQNVSDLQADIVGREEKSNKVSSGLALYGNDYHEDVSDDKYPTTKLVHEWAMEGYTLGSVAIQRLNNDYYNISEVDTAISNAIGVVLGGAS